MLGHHRAQPAVVAFVRGLPGLALTQCGFGLGHRREPAEDEVELDRHRLLAPQRAVVVEHGEAILDRHGLGAVLTADARDERDDRLLRRTIAPARQATQRGVGRVFGRSHGSLLPGPRAGGGYGRRTRRARGRLWGHGPTTIAAHTDPSATSRPPLAHTSSTTWLGPTSRRPPARERPLSQAGAKARAPPSGRGAGGRFADEGASSSDICAGERGLRERALRLRRRGRRSLAAVQAVPPPRGPRRRARSPHGPALNEPGQGLRSSQSRIHGRAGRPGRRSSVWSAAGTTRENR
jgi:hypothetical protein